MAARRGPFFSRTCTTTPLEGAEPRLGSPAAALSPSLGKGSMAERGRGWRCPGGLPSCRRRRSLPPPRGPACARARLGAPRGGPLPSRRRSPPRRPRFSQPRPLPSSLPSPSLLGLSANRVELTRLGLPRGRSPAAVGNAPARLRRFETKGRAASAASRPFCQGCPRARPLTHSFTPPPPTHTPRLGPAGLGADTEICPIRPKIGGESGLGLYPGCCLPVPFPSAAPWRAR